LPAAKLTLANGDIWNEAVLSQYITDRPQLAHSGSLLPNIHSREAAILELQQMGQL
jgi:hypothetical protein